MSTRSGSVTSGPFLDARFQQLDHFRDPGVALLRAAFGGVNPAKVAAPVELGQRVKKAAASGAVSNAAATSGARFARCGPSGYSTTSTSSPGPMPQWRRQAGPNRIPRPEASGSITARTPMPLTVPATWCSCFGPQASSGSTGTGTMTRLRLSAVTLAVNRTSLPTQVMLAQPRSGPPQATITAPDQRESWGDGPVNSRTGPELGQRLVCRPELERRRGADVLPARSSRSDA